MIELGGNIKLEGFEDVEPRQMIIVRKVVGTYARKLSDGMEGFESLGLELKKGDKFEVTAKLTVKGETKEAKAGDANLFFALSSALNKLAEK